MNNDFSVSGELNNKGCKHCAALFLIKPKVGFKPKAEYRNGTITFIKYNGVTYGVTCKHVVEALRNKKEELNDSGLCFATIVKRNIFIIDRFQTPPPDDPFTQDEPDIAIQQIHHSLCKNIGKEPFDLTESSEKDDMAILHGVTIGFPEEKVTEKSIHDFPDYQIQMPCVHAVAKLNKLHDNEFTLFSELDVLPETINLSGMSGGPIFWSTHHEYGLLGITQKGLPTEPETEVSSNVSLGGRPRVYIKGHRITYERFGSWINHLGIDKNKFQSEEPLKINFSILTNEL